MLLPRLVRSASFKFTLLYASVFCLSVIVLGIIVFLGTANSLEQQVRSHIVSDLAQLMNDYEEDGMDELRHDIRERVESNASGRLYYAIESREGRMIFDPMPSLPDKEGWYEMMGRNGHPLLMYVKPLRDGYRLAVTADMRAAEEMEDAVRNGFALALAAMIVTGGFGGLLISRRFLSRVDHMTRTAESIGRSGLSSRVPLRGTADEFDHLAQTINHMLDRIEKLIDETRHVTTNIAHDLRTPLGRLRQKLEMMGDSPAVDDALTLLDGTLETFSALLRIAEIESGARRAGFAECDLSALAEELLQSYQPVAEEQNHPLTAQIAAGIKISGDRSLLAQLIVNLIENAIRHTASGTAIHMSLQRQQSDAELILSDQGTGVPHALRDEVLKPFFRVDKSRTGEGVGLGMSLVAAIASLHHAVLTLEDNKPGLRVRIRFPVTG